MHLALAEHDQTHTSHNGLRPGEVKVSKAPHLCLHELLEGVTESYGPKLALVCGDSTFTFDELNTFANRFARGLIRRGIGSGDLVGVAVDRSVQLVGVLLAVLKAGAAYVPIEPLLPPKRISQMVEDSGLKLLITGANAFESFTNRREVPCLCIDDILEAIGCDVWSRRNIGAAVRSGDLAYVMYTSGSTGRPKGVEISHGNLSNLLLSMQKEPGCIDTDRLLAITTVSFDMAVLELFLPLLCGATTVVAERHQIKDTTALIGLMEHHRITIMQGTPAIWQMLLDSGWRGEPRLSKILCGGEALSRALADRLLACGDMMWNMYGPTEATVYASIWRVRSNQDVIVGGPISGTDLYVLDDGLSPVPLGSPGELYIGGAGVARGYRNNDELNRARFLDNPFHHGLMYRTGDLARFLSPGKLAVMGRLDAQVKIRGHRVELGDIEAAITSYDGVSGAVVVCRDGRLAAYFVRTLRPLAKGGAEGNGAALDRTLRAWLAERLPDYMMPAFFVEVKAFPVTMNGKIDRNALPDPVVAIRTAPVTAMPRTELERQVFEAWSKILEHNCFGVDDNFFEIGGDSVRLVRVQRELEKLLDRPVPSPTLFEYYTIRMLATHLGSSIDRISENVPAAEYSRAANNDKGQDIAIISTACRLPGGVTTPESFWELLDRGGDAITEVPKERWDADSLCDAKSDVPDKSCCQRGGFVPSVGSFDISFFGISPREARSLDPAQYMMLETCWEGFERAGYTAERLRDTQTGVFIGTSNILSHQGLNPTAVRELADLDGYTVTGSAGGTMSGRISYHLGLQGPSMTVDTACSSSLVATHLACNALRRGECDMAVSGGITLLLNPGLHVELGRLQGISPDGRCRSFSSDTQGTGWSEGSVVVMLKRLSDAQRDGDFIQAVIRGTAVNHDGRTATLSTPSGSGQQRLIRTALTDAKLRPEDIDYVEAHGTGTKLGDPIEGTALAEVFGPGRAQADSLLIGSVKSNIGHTQAAAGLAGLLKVVLAMQHNSLPQTLHVTEPTPAVDWQGANMTLMLSKRPWIRQGGRLRRAGVSAFGIGGTNAHVIIEEPPRRDVTPNNAKITAKPLQAVPFLLSADTDAGLLAQAEKLHHHFGRPNVDDVSPFDVAYSLATTRNHFRRRLALTARDKSELLEELRSTYQTEPLGLPASSGVAGAPRLAMLFTGQGSQWPGMGKDLCDAYPVFEKMIREIAAEFNAELELPLLDVMWAAPGSTAAMLLDRTDFAQAALFTLEVALWQLWKTWGVSPDFVLGHSLGELVAAYVAGVMDLPDACRLVAARGRLMQSQSGNFGMLSIGTSATEITTAIEQLDLGAAVDVAVYNAPKQTVISGTTDGIEKIANHFAERSCKIKTLMSGYAFHSRHIEKILADFEDVVKTIRFNPPGIGVFSSRYGRMIRAGELEQADYWVRQVREPVRFSDCILGLANQGVNVFLELGPHPVLSGLGAACLAEREDDKSVGWLQSLSRGKDGVLTLQCSAAQLHVRHVPINWQAYFEPFRCRHVQLPTYAFQRNRFLHQSSNRQRQTAAVHLEGKSNGNTVDHGPHSGQGSSQFEILWHPVRKSYVQLEETWGLVVLDHNSAWAARVTTTLVQHGIRLVRVEHLQHAKSLDGLICLWDSDFDVTHQVRDLVGKALAQLQAAAQDQFAPPLVWFTRRAVGTSIGSNDRAIRIGAGPLLWGLMRTARSEHPELRLRLIDLDDDTPGDCIASVLRLNTEPECAVRQGRVLVPRMQHIDAIANPLSPSKRQLLRPDGAVLITGGLGHLGARVARWLASDHGIFDLVLVSRHGMDAPGADALVSELSMLGAAVTVVAGDIADPECVGSIMTTFNKGRPLRGVVHAAGVVDSGVLSSMTHKRCETTIAPKAYGAWLLHQATQEMDLDLFLMFSSISGVLGMPGLANYAAANTFLDALAHLRRAQGLPATSVAYGTWAGGSGMAARLSRTTLSHLDQFGLRPLSSSQGIDSLREAAISARPLTVAAALNLDQLQDFYEEQGGYVPPLFSSLLAKTNTATEEPLPSLRNLPDLLGEAEPKRHPVIILNMVQRVVAKALGFSNPLDVELDRPLKEIGIDSLTAMQIRNHLATQTGLKLSINIAFLHPNLRALGQSLLSQLQGAGKSGIKSSAVLLDMPAVSKGCLDSRLTFDKPTRNGSGHPSRPPGCVFLTGATGFVGAFILHELLMQGITTYCLVRTDCIDKARQRVVGTLHEYGLWQADFTSLIKPVVGDIARPLLGLPEKAFLELADQVEAICHSGGLVDWMRPMQDYVGPNIVSAHEILRLASRGRAKAVHLVSTISTLPKHMGLDLKEEDLEFGYGTSKFVAERLVAAARWRGANASIYRLPYVTASTTSGHFRHDRGDFLHNLIAGSLEMGAFPSLDADMSAVLPVDYLAKSIVAVMTADSCHQGRDWDFLNTSAPSCDDFFRLMCTCGDRESMEPRQFGAWKRQALEHANKQPTSPLARIAAVLDSYTDETAATMFKGSLVGENVFGNQQYPAPLIDEQFVSRYLERIGR